MRFLAATLVMLLIAGASTAGAADSMLTVKPSLTDARITARDFPHVIMYDRAAKPGNLLLFLDGTGGRPPGPVRFLSRAAERGYRVIYLSYVNTPAVAQVCIGATLLGDPDCARKFREKRIFGNDTTTLIGDAPQDAIMNRFEALLRYLGATDPQGQWGQYLDTDSPMWSRIAVAGQSQGGGMAEFIAQRRVVARVITFSGGWDLSRPGEVAGWYHGESVTPPDRWYGTYNVAEPTAKLIWSTYIALGIPAGHTFALNLPAPPGRAHGAGVNNPDYQHVWDQLLGNGNP